MSRKLDRAQIEIELLRESRSRAGLATHKFPEPKSSSSTNFHSTYNHVSNRPATLPLTVVHGPQESLVLSASSESLRRRNIKLCRQVYTLEEVLNDPLKVRLYIDKLNFQIKEKVRHYLSFIQTFNISENSGCLTFMAFNYWTDKFTQKG